MAASVSYLDLNACARNPGYLLFTRLWALATLMFTWGGPILLHCNMFDVSHSLIHRFDIFCYNESYICGSFSTCVFPTLKYFTRILVKICEFGIPSTTTRWTIGSTFYRQVSTIPVFVWCNWRKLGNSQLRWATTGRETRASWIRNQ